jgi:hypothetical protein
MKQSEALQSDQAKHESCREQATEEREEGDEERTSLCCCDVNVVAINGKQGALVRTKEKEEKSNNKTKHGGWGARERRAASDAERWGAGVGL